MGDSSYFDIAEIAIQKALDRGATQAEIRILSSKRYLTRFANSYIHQNTGEINTQISLRCVINKKVSRVSSNKLSMSSIDDLVNRAIKIANVLEENPEFKSLPEPEPISEISNIYVKRTAECTPERRAEIVKELIDEAHALSGRVKSVAGALSTDEIGLFVMNSLGIKANAKATIASINVNVISKDNSSEGFGYASSASNDINDINPREVGREAAERATNSLGAKKIEPGEYDVVLEPYAVATALTYMGFSGFNAQAVQDGISFMLDLKDKKVFNDDLTIYDDGLDLRGLAFPFDAEGVPKKRVVLIENGVPREVAYDSYTAHKENKKSTGHATGFGPLPTHIFMEKRDAKLSEMIEEINYGLLVTRFHYVRIIYPRKLVLTGMTRDGTWLIKNGEIAYPVKNLRFTESMIKAFSNIELIGKITKKLRSRFLYGLGSIVVPSLMIKKFQFTGSTEY